MPDPGFYLVIVEPVESSQLQADFTVQKALKSVPKLLKIWKNRHQQWQVIWPRLESKNKLIYFFG